MVDEHQLIKLSKGNGWKCEVCHWEWTSKPRSSCPGCHRYDYGAQPDQFLTEVNLHKKNLKPQPDAKPDGIIILKKFDLLLYDENKCVVDDPKLPPIINWGSRGDLKTSGELRKLNLAPHPDTKPSGVGWVWDKDTEWGKWIQLYRLEDCQWHSKDSWITKTTLKKTYLLSDGWIKRIGEPDKLLPNPKYRRAFPINLYSRHRVEEFLADNAEEYAAWIDKRDRYIEIFEANREKIFYKRNLIKEQTKMCLNCASGIVTERGFLCAVHPMGQENLPCPDWFSKKNLFPSLGIDSVQ